MDRQQLTPIAEMLTDGYLEAVSFSRDFRDRFDQPPSRMTKVHLMLSVVQAAVNRSDAFVLGGDYAEYGRVEITDRATGRVMVLRSKSSVRIERGKRPQSEQLFETIQYISSDVVMLIHEFDEFGVNLSIAGSRCRVGKSRLEVVGIPSPIGSWAFGETSSSATFDQGNVTDPFAELGDIDLDASGQS